MELVIQKHSSGCGIACVAMITSIAYETIVDNYRTHFPNDKSFRTDLGDIMKLLKMHGVSLGHRKKFKNWNAVPDFALMYTKYKKEGGVLRWHWIVFKREGGKETVYDPAKHLKNNIRNPKAVSPKYYHAILIDK